MTSFIKTLFIASIGAISAHQSDAQRMLQPVKLVNTGIATVKPLKPLQQPSSKMVVVTPELDTLVLVPNPQGRAEVIMGAIVKENGKRKGETHIFQDNKQYFVGKAQNCVWARDATLRVRVDLQEYDAKKYEDIKWSKSSVQKPANK